MKMNVYGQIYVSVSKEVEIDDSELAGLSKDEIHSLFIERAHEEFSGVDSFLGNGGTDKLIGVTEQGESLWHDGEVDFDEVTEI